MAVPEFIPAVRSSIYILPVFCRNIRQMLSSRKIRVINHDYVSESRAPEVCEARHRLQREIEFWAGAFFLLYQKEFIFRDIHFLFYARVAEHLDEMSEPLYRSRDKATKALSGDCVKCQRECRIGRTDLCCIS